MRSTSCRVRARVFHKGKKTTYFEINQLQYCFFFSSVSYHGEMKIRADPIRASRIMAAFCMPSCQLREKPCFPFDWSEWVRGAERPTPSCVSLHICTAITCIYHMNTQRVKSCCVLLLLLLFQRRCKAYQILTEARWHHYIVTVLRGLFECYVDDTKAVFIRFVCVDAEHGNVSLIAGNCELITHRFSQDCPLECFELEVGGRILHRIPEHVAVIKESVQSSW